MIEVSRVLLTAEEVHITNLEVRPEMARRVAVGIPGMFRSKLVIRQPIHHVVVRHVGRVGRKELLRLGPQIRDTLRGIEEVDGEAIGDVVVGNVVEDIVIDVTEELDLGLNAPVVAVLLEDGMAVKHATVPATHLVVRDLVAVLDVLLLQNFGGLLEEIHVDPIGDAPVFLGYLLCKRDGQWLAKCANQTRLNSIAFHTPVNLCLDLRLGPLLELLGERLVVEEDPGVIELAVPGALQIAYRRNQLIEFLVSDKRDDGGGHASRVGAVRIVVVVFGSP